MKESIQNKLHTLIDRHEEVAGLLADPDIINDQNQFRELFQEYAQLEPVVNCFQEYKGARDDLAAAEEMMMDDDADVREMALEEKKEASEKVDTLEIDLQKLLLPKDPHDESNIFLEIRAGTGGDEAAIFAGDLLYKNFGVTRHGRVIFYDYDEIEFMTDINFRHIPEPMTPEQEMAAEPWYSIGDHDVFPEEFARFITGNNELRRLILQRHPDLFDADYWKSVQQDIRNHRYRDIYPYSSRIRFRRGTQSNDDKGPG